MGRSKNRGQRNNRKSGHKCGAAQGAAARPLQGMDQKAFRFNDVQPIVVNNPTNSTSYLIIVSADVNGWTYTIQDVDSGTVVGTSTGLYGQRSGQFQTQSIFYTQYYMDNLEVDLTLTSGGSTYAVSPMVTQVNPNGADPFVFAAGSGSFIEQLSAVQNVEIHQPYAKNKQHLNYQRWLVAMSNRAWRQTRDQATASRELYPTDSAQPAVAVEELFKLPTIVKAFTVSIPESRFAAQAGAFLLGILEFKAHYKFSQRRTDINDLARGIQDKAAKTERERLMNEIKLNGITLTPQSQAQGSLGRQYPKIDLE